MSNWKEIAKISLDIRDKSIPKQWLLEPSKLPGTEKVTVLSVPAESGALTPEEIKITESDVSELLEAYKSSKWTVRQVVTAFLKKAVIINQLVR
jgi:Tfp pilus assembly PilM family ATPase